MLVPLLAAVTHAGSLPGIAVPFEELEEGGWVLAESLPDALVAAGAQPGWKLEAVDGLSFDDPKEVQRRVAAGPARNVQLLFSITEEDQTILVARRAPLVRAVEQAYVPWPDGLTGPVTAWQDDGFGTPHLTDGSGLIWSFDATAGALERSVAENLSGMGTPPVFWQRSQAGWAVAGARSLRRGSVDWAKERFDGAARLPSFRGQAGEHLLVADSDGVRVWSVTWPSGTPALPGCQSRVPETCLTSARQILDSMSERPGATDEALRQLGVACRGGVHRACYESVALEEPNLAARVQKCIADDTGACNDVARTRYEYDPDEPDELVVGLLEYACELEASGTLGERLRRLEDVGAGCVLLSNAYDARAMPDMALLNLDQACVIGRAEACEEADRRRQQAFAARTVRECEDPDHPIASACVDLGRLQQTRPVPVATLDDFDAFLRGCSLGAVDGCVFLADYVDRWGIEHSRVRTAEKQLLDSCGTGEQRACVGAGHLLVRHEPRTKAYGEALTLFSGACEAGSGEGCVAGAEQRRIGKARRVSAPSQVELWGSACERNQSVGCAGLGERLAKGRASLSEAYGAYNRACEMGHAHSCSQLGQLVLRRHTPAWEGEQPSKSYLERGCDNGDPEGCFWLAEEDLPKKGEPDESTYVLLDRSCEGEHGSGCARLAQVHLERKSNFDDEIAARHLDTACNNGHYDSCRVLGGMYLRGKGVERDRQRANELLERFRLNAKRKHVRAGFAFGAPYGLGLEGEVLLPIPVGPAISVGGHIASLPAAGALLPVLDGDEAPLDPPNLRITGVNARLYPNHQGRGLYGSVGLHTWAATLNGETLSRSGWNARLGIRSQTKALYTGLEIGMGQYGIINFQDFDDESEGGSLPLILPALGFSIGLAVL
ncbi:MAG: sel1 repeat family protein [Myxococcales bacterium]|nr:sel1 repeat family protein [Myxococcales bacterium]